MAENKNEPQNVESCCLTKDVDKKESPTGKPNVKKIKTKSLQRSKAICKPDSNLPRKPALQIAKAVALQRQRTVTLLCYKRKSHSQLDLKEARRNGTAAPLLQVEQTVATAVPANASMALAESPLVAGLRIYNEIMLYSWRERGEKIKALTSQVERNKQNAMNSKNQLHLYKSLFVDEQARTKELSEELGHANERIASLQKFEADLKARLANSENKRSYAESQLLIKTQDHHAVNVYFKQTKNELFKLMTDHQAVQAQYQSEQQKVLELEDERAKLIKTMKLMSNDASRKEEQLHAALKQIADMETQLNTLTKEMANLKSNYDLEYDRLTTQEIKMKNELESLHTEAEILRRCLAGTVGQRVRDCWNASVMLQRTSFGFVHWFAASILPTLPPPMAGCPGIPMLMPFFLTIEKAVNMVKH